MHFVVTPAASFILFYFPCSTLPKYSILRPMFNSRRPTTADPRILIVRLSAIGDVIQSTPIACALRDRFPKSFIAWAIEGRTSALLEGHRAIDELIVLPKGWLKSPGGVWQLRRRLLSLKFDVAIDGQGLTKAALLARLSAAPRRIGFGKPWGRELSPWLNTELVDTPPDAHVVDRNMMLLKPLGIDAPTVRFDFPKQPAAEEKADAAVRQLGVESGFAIINPGAGWPSKLWPTDRFAAVAAHLFRKHQLPTLVVWAGKSEREMADAIVNHSEGAARLAPDTTLVELAALARRARLFIGSDTGPLHLAAAVDTPCVGLYGPWPAKRHGPYGSKNVSLQKAFYEGPTKGRRSAPPSYMEAITTADVCSACDQFLERK